MMLISHLWGEEAYLKHVRGLMRAVAIESVQNVENLLQPAEHLIRTARNLMESEVVPRKPELQLERYFFEEIKVNTNFSGMYFGWMNGDFLFIWHNPSSLEHPFMSKYVQQKDGKRFTKQIYRTASFSERASVDVDTDFDPRTRPWFKAVGGMNHSWTEPYIHFTSQRPGITVSVPVLNDKQEPIGVLGLDIEISNLSYFLSKNELSPNSSAMIATSDKRAVAHTDFDSILQQSPGDSKEYYLVKVDDMDDALTQKAISELEAQGKAFVSDEIRTVKLEHKGETYHAVFHSYNKLGLEWTVVLTAPERDFIETIRMAQRWQILTAVISSLIITLIAFLLALRFLKPVGELQESVLRNDLTGLYNRRALDSFGNAMVKDAHARGKAVSMAMIDIDCFKGINDNYGHPVGDEVLVAVSQRMLNGLKKTDVLARYGGEEFALMLVGADLQAAKRVCERLRAAVDHTAVMTKSGSIRVTVSIGVEMIDKNNDYFHDALSAADQALYAAKRSGRNKVCAFRESGHNI